MLYLKKAQFKVNYLTQKLYDKYEEAKAYNLAKNYKIAEDYKRIYLFHIRKTGGTSLNHMFLSLGGEDGQEVYQKVCKKKRVLNNGKIFIGWDQHKIKNGNYYYGFSHLPCHQLTIPKNTFTITCLRDPIKRILSLYKMLTYYRDNNIPHPGMKRQKPWLGDSFEVFIERIPKEELLNQLYMFSATFDFNEAFHNITNLSYFFFTEDFNQGISDISSRLNLCLHPIHTRKSSKKLEIHSSTRKSLEEKLAPEFELYNKLKEYKKDQTF